MTTESVAPRGTVKSNFTDKVEEFYFSYLGKDYRIFRPAYRNNWQFRVSRGGKEYPRSLGTPIRNVAKEQAIIFLKAFFSETWEDRISELRQKALPQSTVGELLDCYKLSAGAEIKVAPETVGRNAAYLLRVIATVNPDVKDPRALRAEKITEEAFREYIRIARAEGRSDSSIRSTLAQARSVFTPKLRHLYAAKLQLPKQLMEFKPLDANLTGSTEAFVPIPSDTVKCMESAALELPGNVRRCYFLMARLGLRNKEARYARKSWFEMHEGKRVLVLKDRPTEEFKLKNSLPGVIPVEDAVWYQLTHDLPEDAVFLVNFTAPTMRRKITDRAINSFVRQFLPDRQKGAYELRKWAGSIVASRARSKFGDSAAAIYAAQIFLRHRSIKTTEAYYVTYLKTVSGVTFDDIQQIYHPAEEAKQDPLAPWLTARGWLTHASGQWAHETLSPVPCAAPQALVLQMELENSASRS